MKKAESDSEPLLFDLPLQETKGEAEALLRPNPAPPRSAPKRSDEGVRQELLFKEAHLETSPQPLRRGFSRSPDEDDEVLVRSGVGLKDRLLGGIADLGIHATTLAATALGVVLMDVTLKPAAWPAFAVLGVVFSFFYCVISLAFWGQTPGMAWIGHVGRSVTDEPLTFGQAILRWLGVLLTLILAGLPLLIALTGRSLADRLSDSKTVEA
jgi:RDD family